MTSNKPQNIKLWIEKIFNDSVTKSLSDFFSYILKALFTGFFAILLVAVVFKLNEPVTIPVYAVASISLFALVGVFVPVVKIKTVLDKKRIENKVRRIIRIQFEEFPREWSSRCKFYKESLYWEIDDPEVFCTNHSLKLELERYNDVHGMQLLVSKCPECEMEKKKYYTDESDDSYLLFGIAVHKMGNPFENREEFYEKFIVLIRNKILRELEKK